MRVIKFLLIFLLLHSSYAWVNASSAWADEVSNKPLVIIFDTHDFVVSVTGAEGRASAIHQFELDGMSLAEKYLSEGLPSTESLAQKDVMSRLDGREAEISKMVGESIRGIRLTEIMNVRYLPAVVIDREYVIYGVTDLNRALDIWRREAR